MFVMGREIKTTGLFDCWSIGLLVLWQCSSGMKSFPRKVESFQVSSCGAMQQLLHHCTSKMTLRNTRLCNPLRYEYVKRFHTSLPHR